MKAPREKAERQHRENTKVFHSLEDGQILNGKKLGLHEEVSLTQEECDSHRSRGMRLADGSAPSSASTKGKEADGEEG